MLYIVLMTYYTENLVISLDSCKQYCNKHGATLIIHNDNPNELLRRSDYKDIDIINEVENQGMLDSRINSLMHIRNNYDIHPEDLVIFMDDDDIMCDFNIPEFITPKLLTNCVMIRKSVQLINVWRGSQGIINKYINEIGPTPNYTVGGSIYKLQEFINFAEVFNEYEPEIKMILGIDKILGSEDDILDGCYHHYVKYLGSKYATESDIVTVIWNFVESREGRYESDDFRYGIGDHEKMVQEFQVKFNEILNGFIPWYQLNYEKDLY